MKLKKIIPAFLLLSTVAVGLWLTPTQASADAADTMVDISGKKCWLDIGITGLERTRWLQTRNISITKPFRSKSSLQCRTSFLHEKRWHDTDSYVQAL